jgi:tetratricopeptide (TPR) repeat protein
MNIGYVFLMIVASAAYFVSNVPTPDQMVADFTAAQKFYTSAAYDQAIELYGKVGNIQSRFVDEEKIVVSIGQMQLHLKEATLYQTGNSYNKMATLELDAIKNTKVAEQKQTHEKLSREYIEKATECFNNVQEVTQNDELKVMSQKMIIDTWYLVNDLDRVIVEGQRLIDRYPSSQYVQDALYNIAWAHYDAKRYDQAIANFNELVKKFPNGKKVDRSLFQVGEAYFDQKKYDEAIPSYQRLVDKMRINQLTPIEIQKIQRDKLAGLTDDTALDLAARAALRIGTCYGNSGRYDEAETAYKKMAQLFTFDKNLIYAAYTSLSDMYYEKGQFDDSIQAYRDAIDEVPDRLLSAKMQYLTAQRYATGYTDKSNVQHKYHERSIAEYNNYIINYSDIAFRAGFDLDRAFFELGRQYYELGIQMISNQQKDLANSNFEQAITTYKRVTTDFPATKLKEQIDFYTAMAYQEYGSEQYLRNSIEWYNKLLTDFPETVYKEYSYIKMGRAYKSLKEYDRAIEYYNKMIAEFPESESKDAIWYEIGSTQKEKTNDEVASVEYWSKISRKNKQLFTTARLLSAQALQKQQRDQQVIDILNYALEDTSAIENSKRLAQLYLMRGNSFKTLGQIDRALNDFTLAYNIKDPETQEMAAVYRAGIYIDQKQYSTAENDLRELMQSKNAEIRKMAQLRLAFISVSQNKSQQAVQTYLDLYEGTQDTQEKLGYLRNLIQLSSQSKNWSDLNKYANMMIESQIAVDKKPEGQAFYYIEEAYYMLGDAAEIQAKEFETAGNVEQAEKKNIEAVNYYTEAYEKFPKSFYSSDMLLKMGVIFLTKLQKQTDYLDISASYFEKYITNFPDTPNTEMANYYLGFCYYNGRRFKDANTTFKQFAQKYPDSEFTPESIFYYSDGDYNLGNMESAIKGFDTLLSRYPKNEKAAEALYTKAWCYLDMNQPENAISTFKEMIEKFPNNQLSATAQFSIADYYYNTENYNEAITNYQLVLEKYPDTEVAKKVPETLSDLKETVAYIDYDKAMEIFSQAQKNSDLNLYSQAAELFKEIATKYPDTESEIGSYSNMGICYEALGQWQNAVKVYDKVIEMYTSGKVVSNEAYTFATAHRNYLQANKKE